MLQVPPQLCQVSIIYQGAIVYKLTITLAATQNWNHNAASLSCSLALALTTSEKAADFEWHYTNILLHYILIQH